MPGHMIELDGVSISFPSSKFYFLLYFFSEHVEIVLYDNPSNSKDQVSFRSCPQKLIWILQEKKEVLARKELGHEKAQFVLVLVLVHLQ